MGVVFCFFTLHVVLKRYLQRTETIETRSEKTAEALNVLAF